MSISEHYNIINPIYHFMCRIINKNFVTLILLFN